LHAQLTEKWHLLSERQKDVMTKRYGLNGQSPQTYRAIAEDFHLTVERIRQIDHKVIRIVTGAETYGLSRRTFATLRRRCLVSSQYSTVPPEWRTDDITPDYLRRVPDAILARQPMLGSTMLAEIRGLYPYVHDSREEMT
jgi:hypothetical protein